MADLKKFEEMLDRLVNEDKEGAEELFHEIVVEKSREIYESLLESELEEDDDDIEEAADEEVDESDEDLDEATDEEVDESDEEVEEGFDLDEFEVEADPMMGGDAADNMIDAMDDEPEMDMGDEDEGEEGDMEDRVEDLEDALEDLKAEFEKMMADDDDAMGDDDEGEEEEGDEEEAEEESLYFGEAEDEEVEESDEDLEEGKMKDKMIGDSEKMSKAEFAKKYGKEAADDMYETTKSASEQMREYVEKVNGGGLDAAKIGGDNGANTKSAVAGKNDMGGTAANMTRADASNDPEAGAGSKVAGSALSDTSEKEDNAGNVNVPGGKASKSMKAQPKGHGAEKKGAGETADNKKSVVGK